MNDQKILRISQRKTLNNSNLGCADQDLKAIVTIP